MNNADKTLWVILLTISAVSGFAFSVYMHRASQAAMTRVYHSPVSIVQALKNDKASGKTIYQHFCASCHAPNPQINLNAPCITDKKRWERIKRIGNENLLRIILRGTRAMPARGGCFECSDAQLAATLDYMLEAAHQTTQQSQR